MKTNTSGAEYLHSRGAAAAAAAAAASTDDRTTTTQLLQQSHAHQLHLNGNGHGKGVEDFAHGPDHDDAKYDTQIKRRLRRKKLRGSNKSNGLFGRWSMNINMNTPILNLVHSRNAARIIAAVFSLALFGSVFMLYHNKWNNHLQMQLQAATRRKARRMRAGWR